jgi:DNA-directed RNA polymerase subunit beta'
MAHYDPTDAFEKLKSSTADTIKGYFPIEGNRNTLVANKVWVDDNLDTDDIRSQKEVKLHNGTWSIPVRAELELRDKATGKVKDRMVMNIAQLPKITRRFSYIVNGSEQQVNNVFRLKSGVYTRRKENGELEGMWNLEKGKGFKMNLNPESKKITIRHQDTSAQVNLYPVLKVLGVDDDTIEKHWGKEILSANKSVSEDSNLRSFYKSLKGVNPESTEVARKFIIDELGKTKLRPDSTELTLGKPYHTVNGEALLAGSHRLLQVSRLEAPTDDRDSLQFKDLYSAEDLLAEHMGHFRTRQDVTRKIKNVLDKGEHIKTIVSPDLFKRPIMQFFTSGNKSERSEQTNPVSFLAGNRRTTSMGKGAGGISSSHQVSLEAQSINPSHLGFLDPVQTPEGSKIGVVNQLAWHVTKEGHELKIPVYSMKEKKTVMIGPGKAFRSNLAFRDQYIIDKDRQPVPVDKMVKVSNRDGTISMVKPSEVDYVIQSTAGMFDFPANMLPFLQSSQGNRTMVASRQLEQAVPLINRQQPLVQVGADKTQTFEKIVGGFTSHRSRHDGVVEKVTDEGIIFKDLDGKRHEVQLYHDFPLNDPKGILTSLPLVKAGDHIKKGQVIGDSNFTRNGVLSLGTNLRVAYMPFQGYNFEDGVVVSESAAKKLTSQHMARERVDVDDNTILNKKTYLAHTAGTKKDQAEKLDDQAVVKEGTVVNKDDILIGVLKKENITPDKQVLGLISKKLISPIRPREKRWESDNPGIVTKVVKHDKDVTVFVKVNAQADVGDKIVGRHGNKGIITAILPDHEMPKDKNERHVEVLLNPAGVPGRINLGQVLETAAAKIAEKDGKPYVVVNFDPKIKDYTRHVQKELAERGIHETEELFDAKSGRSFGQILTGPQYILKLHHMASKGLHARSGGPGYSYDSNMQPKGGGHASGQTMDALGLYAMLAHNARENIREMQSYKADMNDEFWTMLQAGDSPPTPKVPFVYNKLESYLKGMGIDVKKTGNDLILQPLTDKKVLEMAPGELRDPARTLRAKDAKPEAGGIFDPVLTGTQWPGGTLGHKWTHIKLPERIPNPIFEKPITALLGLTDKDYDEVMEGRQAIGSERGPTAIVKALKEIDAKAMKQRLEKSIPTLSKTKLNNAYKQLKYLRALDRANMNTTDAYTMKYIAVLPPIMRPFTMLPSGDISYDPINRLYNRIGTVNHKLAEFDLGMPPEEKIPLHAALYDAVKALHLTGMKYQGRHRNSIAEQLAAPKGKQPKHGFFQSDVIGKRQDMSMRGVIVPEPSMHLDEVMIPRKAAMELFKPFVVRRLVQQDHQALEAQKLIKENHPAARSALEAVIKDRPILLKRDPVLHKFGVQAFRPVLTEGKAVKIHPLAVIGYNADFDGDKMSAYVPVGQKAVKEAYKMMPSNNLFSPTTGFLMYKPTHESTLGLFKLTEVGKHTGKRFKTAGEAALAVRKGEIGINDLIHIDDVESGANDLMKLSTAAKTTIGRLLVYRALPEKHRDHQLLVDPAYTLGTKRLNTLLSAIAKDSPGDYGTVADRLKDLGNEHATGLSMSLKDFESDYQARDPILKQAAEQEYKIRQSIKDPEKRDEKIVQLYMEAGQKIEKLAKAKAEVSGNKMYDWVKSGARGNWDQFRQMTVAPMLVADSYGKPVPIPIGKSYSEGLDIGSYCAAMHGARMGTISKVQGTQVPGMMGKQLAQTSISTLILDSDCGTKNGISMKLDDPDILDRYTANEVALGRHGKGAIPAGTLMTPEVLSRLRNNHVDELAMRSPLKCEHGHGLCAKCYGLSENGHLHEAGTNIGILSAQSLSEPAVQLSMNSFHTGGVVGAKGTTSQSTFGRVQHLLNMPKILPDSARLATVSGKVEKIEPHPMGGWDVVVAGTSHHVPSKRELLVKRSDQVKAGDALSSGPKNPHDILATTKNMSKVQKYLTDELWGVFHDLAHVRKRNIETFVRTLTNLAEVTDAGDHQTLLPGSRTSLSEIQEFNDKAIKENQKPVKFEHVLQGIKMMPLEMQQDWLARLQSTDLKRTVLDAASEGWKSRYHSTHPIPGMAYAKEFGQGTKEEPWLY